jgi:DNA-binding CsgD family transcriptional regulator
MARLTHHDYVDILNLVNLCNSQLEPRSLQAAILPPLRSIFHTEGEVFYLANQDLKSLDLANVKSLDIEDRYNMVYAQQYCRCDPQLRKALYSRSVVFKYDDIMPITEWLKSVYYYEFLRPQNLKHEMEICLRAGNKLFGMLALLRSKQRRNFQEGDIVRAKVLAPHFTTALHNAILFSSIENERKLLRTGNELLPCGVILSDFELRPIYFNSEAKRICHAILCNETEPANGITSEELSLPSQIVQDCLILKRQSQNWNQIDPLRHQRIVDTQHNQASYCIEVSVIWQHTQISSEPYFLISLEGLSKTDKVNQDILQKKYNLTNREIEIIQYAASGLTNYEIADKLFISKLTVETHLRNIFEKTGVMNRTQLAGLM